MTRRQLRLIVIATVTLVGVVGYESSVLRGQRDELRALEAEERSLEKDLATLHRSQTSLVAELELAERQLAQLPAPLTASDAERKRDADNKAWLARTKALRQLFDDQPDQHIPEMELLTDVEWLRLGRAVDFSTDERIRASLADVRTAAKMKFIQLLATVVRRYGQAGHQTIPTNIHSLAPFFDVTIDFRVLERYELIARTAHSGWGTPWPEQSPRQAEMEKLGLQVANANAAWAVRERSPVDRDFDSRMVVTSGGGQMRMAAPGAWIPDFQDRMNRAREVFREKNQGSPPPNTEAVLPYVDPPFEPATAKRLIEAERAGRVETSVRDRAAQRTSTGL